TFKRSPTASENSFPAAPKEEIERLSNMPAENTAAVLAVQPPQRAWTKRPCAWQYSRTSAIAKQTTTSCWAKVGPDTNPALASASASTKSPTAGNKLVPNCCPPLLPPAHRSPSAH